MIKAVIFDLDNTLYNFDAANEFGIRALAAYTEPVFGWDYPRMKDLYEESREKLTERMGDVGSAHNSAFRTFWRKRSCRSIPMPWRWQRPTGAECLTIWHRLPEPGK